IGNPDLLLNGRFVDEHHRNVVLDRVDAVAGIAFQARPVLHQHDRRFAVRTRKNFKEFGIERHESTLQRNEQNYSRTPRRVVTRAGLLWNNRWRCENCSWWPR